MTAPIIDSPNYRQSQLQEVIFTGSPKQAFPFTGSPAGIQNYEGPRSMTFHY
jgi:hypothetical protein